MHWGWWPDAVPHADLCGRRGVADPGPLRMGASCARIQWHFFCIRIAYRPTNRAREAAYLISFLFRLLTLGIVFLSVLTR
jgi:hypothetical protein